MDGNEKRNNIREKGWMYFWAFALVFLATWIIFTKQAQMPKHSDIVKHMKFTMSLTDVLKLTHNGWHFICWLFYACLPITPAQAAVLTTSLFNGATAVITAGLAERLFNGSQPVWKGKVRSYLPAVLAVVGLTVGSLYLRFYNNNYYLGQGTPNPWHNPTVLAVRPFMLLIDFMTLWYWDLWREEGFEKSCSNKQCRKYQWALTFLLLYSTLTKPSFLMIYCPVCGIVELWRIRKHWKEGEAWKNAILRNLYFIPSLFVFLWQYLRIFIVGGTAGGEGGIIIAPFYVARMYAPSVLISLILRMAFPFLVIVLWRKKIFKEKLFPLIFGQYVVGLLTTWIFAETGNRASHGNFGWGNALGCSFLWIFCLIFYVREMERDWDRIKKEPRYMLRYLIPALFLIWHLLAGICYYIYVLNNMGSQL